MVDALASGASGRKAVEVRVLSWAPQILGTTKSVQPIDLHWLFLEASQGVVHVGEQNSPIHLPEARDFLLHQKSSG